MLGFLEPWDKAVIEGVDFVAAGDSVLVGVHQHATGTGSGVPVEMRYFQVWTFRGDMVLSVQSISERGEAMKAAGLEE